MNDSPRKVYLIELRRGRQMFTEIRDGRTVVVYTVECDGSMCDGRGLLWVHLLGLDADADEVIPAATYRDHVLDLTRRVTA